VMRRLRSALAGIAECVDDERGQLVRAHLDHLDLVIERSTFDAEDRAAARVKDRQGLGLSHRNEDPEEYLAGALTETTEKAMKHA